MADVKLLPPDVELETKRVLKQLSRFSTGSTRYTISVSSFSKVKVQLPCLEEQTKIAHFLSALDRKIAVTNEQIEKTKKWKKGLLQRMFVQDGGYKI